MLSSEDNELLTRVGPDAPMGALIRRFWFPILIADEIPDPDSRPIRVQVLGEFFVAFRDTAGRLGLLDARCPHRGADLSFGINEEGGIRCARCFWKFDIDGKIMDLPMEPDDSPLWTEVRAEAFKAREYGGLIWGYLGPQDEIPEIPEFEWTRVAPEQRHVSRFLVECNYMQGVEGGLDASRVSAIHRAEAAQVIDPMDDEPSHSVRAKSTEYGLMIGTALDAEAGAPSELQVTHWLMPFYTTAPADAGGVLDGVAWVPIDDESTMAFAFTYNPKRPLSKKVLSDIKRGKRVHQVLDEGTVRRKRNKENSFVADGKKPPLEFASRFGSTFELAIACQESMGTIVDRSQEMLGPNDVAVESARRVLMTAAVDLMEGTIPVIVNKGEAYRVRSYAGGLEKGAAFDEDEDVRRGVIAQV